MEWVERFYSLKAEWLGEPATIWEYERARARTIQRLRGSKPMRILELGAGSGGTAAAAAGLVLYALDCLTTGPAFLAPDRGRRTALVHPITIIGVWWSV